MRRWFIRHAYYPLAQVLSGECALDCLRSLERTERMDPAERQAAVWPRLDRLLRESAVHVPFYREAWKQAGIVPEDLRSLQDLSRLPILTRDDLIARREDLLNETCTEREEWVDSSGSSGEPIRTRHGRVFHSWTEAAQWRARRWFGLDIGHSMVALWGRPVKSWGESVSLQVRSAFNGILHLSAFDLSDAQLPAVWRSIRRHRPAYLYGYASALYSLGRWVQEQGEDGRSLRLKVIMSTSEILYDFQRQLLAEVFGAPVSNVYGCAELGAFAHECPAGRMHVSDENVLVEIMHGDGPAPPGEPGDIVVTSFHNTGMPLIRYRIGDVGSVAAETCPCGRTLSLMNVTVGKAAEMVRTSGGRRFSTELFDYVHKRLMQDGVKGIRQFRVVQKSLDRFVVECVTDAEASEASLGAFRRGFQEAIGAEVQVSVQPVSVLPRDATGKLRYFISERPDSPAPSP